MTDRLAANGDQLLQREHSLQFSWQGQQYSGYLGDTLASALLANGEYLLGRSFKYGRPRGVYGVGVEEPNSIVDIGVGERSIPNQRATEVELYPDLQARASTGIPSLKQDRRQLFKFMHKAMRAGFYYKTFIKPQKLWPWYEHVLRSFSGLGECPQLPDPDTYSQNYQNFDVVIIGAGLAGLHLAHNLAGSKQRVLLVDERAYSGGNWFLGQAGDNRAQVRTLVQKLTSSKNITLWQRSTAFALHDMNLVEILQRHHDHQPPTATTKPRQTHHYIRAQKVALATGAHERLLCFSNNDLPMVMLASTLASLVHNYALCPAQRPVLATNNDSVVDIAEHLYSLDIKPVIVDCRAEASESMQRLQELGLDIRLGTAVVAAHGSERVQALSLQSVRRLGANNWETHGKTSKIDCDLLGVSGGWSPTLHLDSHTGGKPKWRSAKQCFTPNLQLEDRYALGAVCSDFTTSNIELQAQQLKEALVHDAAWSAPIGEDELQQSDFYFVPGAEYAFVDMQNDVTLADIQQAITENYRHIEHIKRYTAMGFGSDQGKIGNIVGSAIAAKILDASVAEIGVTTYRPPYTGVTLGALAGSQAGEHFDSKRYTPIHPWHQSQSVVWELVGQWFRPRYYQQSADESMDAAVARECLAARQGLAIMDASTLGKIDIQGPDARKLLNRVYTNAWSKLAPGCCRYGLMLDENGMVIDDGVTACISDNHFLMTTTTGGAARIYTWLERWLQTEWPDMRVWLNSVTDHWGTIAIVGPESRKFMEELCAGSGVDFSAEAFPFMHWRPATLFDQQVRIMRISFSGELSYEINIQSNYALALWQRIMELGAQYNITPYGTEALHVLRAEKGFIIVGQDTDGSVTPQDLGMSWIVKSKSDYSFIGERSLQRSYCTDSSQRKQLVGLLSKDKSSVVVEGSQLTKGPADTELQGHVSSSYHSPILGHPIALALVVNGSQRMGETLHARSSSGQCVAVEICSSVFYQNKAD